MSFKQTFLDFCGFTSAASNGKLQNWVPPTGSYSGFVASPGQATIPGAPTGVTAAGGNASAVVSWTAPASDGGSPITSYVVTASPGGAQQTLASGGTFTGLTNGTAYTFTVHAVNAIGAGPESSASNSVTPSTVPGAPTGVTAVKDNASAVVSWTAPASDGGSAIISYTVTSSPATTPQVLASGGTFTGLTNGTAYTFTVVATNANGNGPSSSASNSVTPSTVPGAPTGVTATAGDTNAVITWTAPASDGGSAITGYKVSSSPATTTQALSSGGTFTGLTNGVAYTFTVVATNANGDGPASSASNSVTPVAPFTPPTDTTFLNNTTVGPGADNRTNLANWLTKTTNGTPALNATNYLGSANQSNTVTPNGNNGAHNSTTGLISASGWKTFGGAFKTGSGSARYVTLYSGLNNTDYATFDLQTGTVAAQGGTATGAIFSGIGQSFYWCRVTFNAAMGSNQTAKFNYGDTAASSQPTGTQNLSNSNSLIAGPFACTT